MIIRHRSSSRHLQLAARVSLLLASVCLTACGGGGGGSSPELPTPATPTTPPAPTTPITPTPPATTPTPPTTPTLTTNPSLPLNPPSTSSGEYRRNYALAAMHADAAYAVGATGKGIVVGVIDSGFDLSGADMQGAYSSDSVDLITGREGSGTTSTDRHGVRVAGVIASRFNGLGTIGVAYESTVLAIRADAVPASDCTEDCEGFLPSDTARAIDYAVSKGARIINMSFGGPEASTPTFRAAVERAVAAGVVFTAAAGNEGDSSDHWPSHLAVETPIAGALLAVGATGPDGTMASFSNRAGSSAAGYITAPGADVITDCDSANSCWRISGTSFAAPQVAGALALLLQYFPNLSGRDAISILLRTADDKGDPGTDAVWGRGALNAANIAKAFEPVGASTLSLPGGAEIDLPNAELGAMLGSAFGDALSTSPGLTTVIHDDYNRLFAVNLADSYRSPRRQSSVAYAAQPAVETAQAVELPAGGALTLAASMPMFPYADDDASPVRAFLRPEAPTSAMASVRMGSFDFTAWRGRGAVAAPQGLGGRNAFTSLASANSAVAGTWRAGAFALGGEGAWAERRTALSPTPVDASRYAAATAAYIGPDFRLSVSAGTLQEPRGALGSEFSPASPLSLAASTRFASVGLDRMLGPLALRAEASMGRTEGGGRLVDIDSAVSSAWRLALGGACGASMACQRFGIELAQPLRVERGLFHAILADTPASYDDPITFSQRSLSAAPTSRELDLRFNIDRPLGDGALRLEAAAAFNPAHQQSKADLGLSAMWRTRF